MTPNEIKTLIDQKIAGQGSMVDVGGALPTILKEIVDMASDTPAPSNNLILTIDREQTKGGRWLLTDDEATLFDQRSIIGVKLPTIYDDEILLYNSSVFKGEIVASVPETITEAFPGGFDIISAYGRIFYANGEDGVAIDSAELVIFGTGEDVDGVVGAWLVTYDM